MLNRSFFVFLFAVSAAGSFGQSAQVSAFGSASSSAGSINFSGGQAFVSQDAAILVGIQGGFEIYESSSPTSVADKGNVFEIAVFPNPVSTSLNVKCEMLNGAPHSGADVAAIYDITGKKLISCKLSPVTKMDVSQLSAGTYFLEITLSNNVVKSFKIIKQQ
ncbi:MAG: T9SS type A sorting domain-containing protein [Prevotella sp.]|nr:T9SS type A sorting domain-containing protein [Prevotella sp.]